MHVPIDISGCGVNGFLQAGSFPPLFASAAHLPLCLTASEYAKNVENDGEYLDVELGPSPVTTLGVVLDMNKLH